MKNRESKVIERLSGGQSGVAGEYLVAAQLSRLGYVASLTLKNTKGIDILASNVSATKSVGIQVKTRQNRGHQWTLNEKNEKFHSPNLFYVFVNLGMPDECPDFYIVPSAVVARYIKTSHRKWLRTPGRRGQEHKDNPLRVFEDYNEEYRGIWSLLKLDD